ncbi:MAG: cyclic nucleotide-binding domain-containing protein [Chitinophaga rupis]
MKYLKEEEFEKNEYLLKSGDICRKLYFVRKGLVYGFYKYRGRKITMRFAQSKELCFVPESFIKQSPSKENLMATVPSIVYTLSNDAVQDLQRYTPQFYKVIEHYFLRDYVEANSCLYMLRSLDGFQRYEWMKEHMPDILFDVRLNRTSTYVGLCSTTLGRFIKQDTGQSQMAARRDAQW